MKSVLRVVHAFGPASGINVVIVSGTGFAAGATLDGAVWFR